MRYLRDLDGFSVMYDVISMNCGNSHMGDSINGGIYVGFSWWLMMNDGKE